MLCEDHHCSHWLSPLVALCVLAFWMFLRMFLFLSKFDYPFPNVCLHLIAVFNSNYWEKYANYIFCTLRSDLYFIFVFVTSMINGMPRFPFWPNFRFSAFPLRTYHYGVESKDCLVRKQDNVPDWKGYVYVWTAVSVSILKIELNFPTCRPV